MELVFIRHGQSEWNAKNLFTGWRDVKLSEQGLAEAAAAGKKLKEKGYEFDIAFTSVLTRAIKTCNIVLEESDQLFVPQIKSWRLNERHYGQLQGMDKKQTAEKYGDEQVHIWRRSYDTLPPLLDLNGIEWNHRMVSIGIIIKWRLSEANPKIAPKIKASKVIMMNRRVIISFFFLKNTERTQ